MLTNKSRLAGSSTSLSIVSATAWPTAASTEQSLSICSKH
jgi:hypothetical protein